MSDPFFRHWYAVPLTLREKVTDSPTHFAALAGWIVITGGSHSGTARVISVPGPKPMPPIEGFALICAVYIPPGVPVGTVKLTVHDCDWFDEGDVNERELGLV